MLASTAVLVGVSIALAVVAGPLYALCERASADLLHPSAYVKAVLG
jgi:formate hydrogenlyase subunit 3/multisubunit Na+/H+ antiporter MnhD subunit